jgi:thymidylate kinase
VEIRFLDVETRVALERARQRERVTPPALVTGRAALLRSLNEEYRRVADHFEIIKT